MVNLRPAPMLSMTMTEHTESVGLVVHVSLAAPSCDDSE
jgi:hypothetical protein